QGMINDVLKRCDFSQELPNIAETIGRLRDRSDQDIARLITVAENHPELSEALAKALEAPLAASQTPVLGITGTGGAGKSSLVDELVRRFLVDFDDKTVAIISVDPSKRKTGGALLGDRIRMNAIHHPRVYMRSLATRQSNLALSRHVQSAIDICRAAGFDLVIVETSGIGQSDTEITEHSDVSLYVMTADYGAATQLEKIDMLDFADVIAINKFDKPGSLDALRDVRKQYRRNHTVFEGDDGDLPVLGTIASQFSDPGTNNLYRRLMDTLVERTGASLNSSMEVVTPESAKHVVIPAERVRYLAEICDASDTYDRFVVTQANIARRLYQLQGAIQALRPEDARRRDKDDPPPMGEPLSSDEGLSAESQALVNRHNDLLESMDPTCKGLLREWPELQRRYSEETYSYEVRGKTFEQPLVTESLSHLMIPRVSLPRFKDWGDILTWLLQENVPGAFPYTAGVFPLKRKGEDPARMFAGEGGPERTNGRFHYLSTDLPAKRLSTAFDSVTLYGENPDHRPDIFGKVGNSGVSVATVDDAKRLYSGFDLAANTTSVSMTINGPAPMLLGFFMNAA
ncbi:MAG: methylmalonyl-CoA mutase family protein, partial [Myxococcota bacterium]|nr:methylmalonyl-CoA mutase family protein [Myxococcota bacterium]